MRLLYITGGFPYPLTSGFLRHFHLIRELAHTHQITLMSLAGPQYRPEHGQVMLEFLERLEVFRMPPSIGPLHRRLTQVQRLLMGRNPAVERMRAAVRSLLEDQSFDVVIQSSKTTTPVLRELPHLPVIVDLCDAASERIRGRMRHSSFLRRPWLHAELAVMRRAERRYLERATHITFASCRDRESLMPHAPCRATVIPNGVDLDYWRRATPARPAGTMAFTGAFHYAPNVDAAVYLATHILPQVRLAYPNTRLLLIGRDPRPEVCALERIPNVTVTGYVDDVRPYLEQATVFVAPLRFGTGIQNKVLEAMAMEVPVVASPLAADGLRTERGERPPIRVGDSATAIASAVIDSIRQHERDSTPDHQARSYVKAHFHWPTCAAKLHQLIERFGSSGEACSTRLPSHVERPSLVPQQTPLHN